MNSIKLKRDKKTKYQLNFALQITCIVFVAILILIIGYTFWTFKKDFSIVLHHKSDDYSRYLLNNLTNVNANNGVDTELFADSMYVVDGPQCQIFKLNPFDPEVMKTFKRQKQKFCVKEKPLTTVAKNESTGSYFIAIDKTSSKDYGLENSSIVCCYQDISRLSDVNKRDTDIELSKCTYFNQDIEVSPSSEFIYIRCDKSTDLSKAVYKNVHVVVQEKKWVIDRFNNFKTKTKKKPISVFMFLVDSMSRLSLIRAMPETNKYLKDNDWFELEGYNKVFESSYSNSMAFLTGFNESESWSICKPKEMYVLKKLVTFGLYCKFVIW